MRIKEYFIGIDFIKGILIILVVLLHVLQDYNFQNNIFYYCITSFFMPLFIGTSGILIKDIMISTISFKKLLNKYIMRLFIPLIIAEIPYALFYYLMKLHIPFSLLPMNIIIFIIFPRGYFWFVQALICYIIVLWILRNILHLTNNGNIYFSIILSILTILISIFAVDQYSLNVFFGGYENYRNIFLSFFGEVYRVYRPQWFIFFIIGFTLRNSFSYKFLQKYYIKIFIISLLCILALYYLNFNQFISILYFDSILYYEYFLNQHIIF